MGPATRDNGSPRLPRIAAAIQPPLVLVPPLQTRCRPNTAASGSRREAASAGSYAPRAPFSSSFYCPASECDTRTRTAAACSPQTQTAAPSTSSPTTSTPSTSAAASASTATATLLFRRHAATPPLRGPIARAQLAPPHTLEPRPRPAPPNTTSLPTTFPFPLWKVPASCCDSRFAPAPRPTSATRDETQPRRTRSLAAEEPLSGTPTHQWGNMNNNK